MILLQSTRLQLESFGVVSVELAPSDVAEKGGQPVVRLVVAGTLPDGALPGDSPLASLQAQWLQHTEVEQLAKGGQPAALDHAADVVRWTGGCRVVVG